MQEKHLYSPHFGAGAAAALRPVRLWPDHFIAELKVPTANQCAHAHTAMGVRSSARAVAVISHV